VTPGELKDYFRREIDDLKAPYLWSDDDVFMYMDVAYSEFCRLTDYLSDATTPDVCQVSVIADEPFADLSPLVTKIRKATMSSTGHEVALRSMRQMDSGFVTNDYGVAVGTNWLTTTGTPKIAVTDVEFNKLRLSPIPTAADTLDLIVYRLPIDTIDASSSEFEVTDRRHQLIFLHKMKSLAYGKHDADVKNEVLEAKFERSFEQMCEAVKAELARIRDKSRTTRCVW
jgi:hypothetical protein